MKFTGVQIKSYKADLAKGDVTLTLALDLDAEAMAARFRMNQWREDETFLTIELTRAGHEMEQLPLLCAENAPAVPAEGDATPSDAITALETDLEGQGEALQLEMAADQEPADDLLGRAADLLLQDETTGQMGLEPDTVESESEDDDERAVVADTLGDEAADLWQLAEARRTSEA